MAAPIRKPAELTGRPVYDQFGNKLGQVKDLYAPGDADAPKWVTVEVSVGLLSDRIVFVPLARLKEEGSDVHVPYSKQHLLDAPEVSADDELSSEDEQQLLDYYAVERGDVAIEDKPNSYQAQIPDGDEPPRRVPPEDLETSEDSGAELEGHPVVDRDGNEVGQVDRLVSHGEDPEPKWAVLKTGPFGLRKVVVPLVDSEDTDGTLHLPYEAGRIKDAPKVNVDGDRLGDADADALCRHFDIELASSVGGIAEDADIDLPRETRDAKPPAMEEGPDSPLTQRRRERAEELGVPSATGDTEPGDGTGPEQEPPSESEQEQERESEPKQEQERESEPKQEQAAESEPKQEQAAESEAGQARQPEPAPTAPTGDRAD